MVQGLTSSDPYEQAGLLQVLLRMQCGNGLMHESIHVSGGCCGGSTTAGCDVCGLQLSLSELLAGSLQGFSSSNTCEQAGLLAVLLRMQCCCTCSAATVLSVRSHA
jgi:hypothetical protein